MVLHEWDTDEARKPRLVTDETGREEYDGTEKPDNLVTWVYDGTSFTPVAKVTDGERYTIVHDYLGTPTQAYDSKGELVWEMLLDVYGEVAECHGARTLVPFRYQGQYEDEETGLYYNRFRYYSPDMGMYISSDPIGLNSREYNFYSYVSDSNSITDPFGLDWNYVLVNAEGKPYYFGRASDNQTMQDVARRHANTKGSDGVRFGQGDTLQKKTDIGTNYDAVRGIEQRGIAENNLLGRGSDKVRGNKINGISETKQKTRIGRKRLSNADKILNGRKVSELPTLDELKFKGGCV